MSASTDAKATSIVDPRPAPCTVSTTVRPRNRLALAGTVLYLLEWVAIIAAAVDVPVPPATSPTAVLAHYQGHADALGFAAGWFALVLVGRVFFAAAIASTVRRTGAPRWLTTTAVASMTASVVLEVATYAVAAGTAQAAQSVPVVSGLNDVAWVLNQMVMPLVGVSVLCLLASTLRSRLFGRWVHLPALLGGVLMVGSAFLVAPRFAHTYDAVGNAGVPLFWVWMIWISVLCWRAPRPSRGPAPEGSGESVVGSMGS